MQHHACMKCHAARLKSKQHCTHAPHTTPAIVKQHCWQPGRPKAAEDAGIATRKNQSCKARWQRMLANVHVGHRLQHCALSSLHAIEPGCRMSQLKALHLTALYRLLLISTYMSAHSKTAGWRTLSIKTLEDAPAYAGCCTPVLYRTPNMPLGNAVVD